MVFRVLFGLRTAASGFRVSAVNAESGKDDPVIVAMGSVCQAIEETIDYLNARGKKIKVVEVHLYRPFSPKFLILMRSVFEYLLRPSKIGRASCRERV